MKTLAIVTGGLNKERTISLKSAKYVVNHIDHRKYEAFIVDLQGSEWLCDAGVIDKNDFSLRSNGRKIKFDAAILILHGHPAEDGRLQGYFEMLDIPYSGCNTFSSALTFHKEATKHYLRAYDIPMAPSIMIRRGEQIDYKAIEQMGLPVFIKPNKYGSSFGISKVTHPDKLPDAINAALEYDEDVMIEAYMDGREFDCGIIKVNGEVIAFPITEIVSHNEFFDYEAKYLGASDEITPAVLPEALTRKCQELSKHIYNLLYCNGVVRAEYILVDGHFHFLEINTIPGLSPASIVPQQARAYGWSDADLVEAIVQSALNK